MILVTVTCVLTKKARCQNDETFVDDSESHVDKTHVYEAHVDKTHAYTNYVDKSYV